MDTGLIEKPQKKITLIVLLPVIWFVTSAIMIILVITLLFLSYKTTDPSHQYSMYASKPLVLGTMEAVTESEDSRAAKIDKVFAEYNCPLTGMGTTFVREADKNGIPYWVVPAISFQESSCGKLTPEPDGEESYNAWGWAVYGTNVKMFDDWEHGIKVVSQYMNERFFSQGVTDLCEIMRTYTPPSEGSWCKGVDYFKDIIDEYQTPLREA